MLWRLSANLLRVTPARDVRPATGEGASLDHRPGGDTFSVAAPSETAHALRRRKGDHMETWHWALVAVAGGVVFLVGLAMMKKGR
jgi:hypothetical protein